MPQVKEVEHLTIRGEYILDRIDKIETNLRGEIGELKGEVGELRGEVGELRGEVKQLESNLNNLGYEIREQRKITYRLFFVIIAVLSTILVKLFL